MEGEITVRLGLESDYFPGMEGWLEDLHGQIGEIFYWVIGFHVLAAIFHHVVRRDDTLKRMK